MSKTFYADGQTGKVAIMEGNFSQTIFDNPQANTDKLYFHSSFHYLRKITQITRSITLPTRYSVSGSTITPFHTATYNLGTTTWKNTDTPINFTYINGAPFNGSHVIQKVNNNIWRVLNLYYTLSSGSIRIQVQENCLVAESVSSVVPAITVNFVVNLCTFTDSLPTGQTTVNITPTECTFNAGKFDSGNYYLNVAPLGFKVYQGAHITLANYAFNVITPSYIGVDI